MKFKIDRNTMKLKLIKHGAQHIEMEINLKMVHNTLKWKLINKAKNGSQQVEMDINSKMAMGHNALKWKLILKKIIII